VTCRQWRVYFREFYWKLLVRIIAVRSVPYFLSIELSHGLNLNNIFFREAILKKVVLIDGRKLIAHSNSKFCYLDYPMKVNTESDHIAHIQAKECKSFALKIIKIHYRPWKYFYTYILISPNSNFGLSRPSWSYYSGTMRCDFPNFAMEFL
jgi:hypothetical protein